MRDELRKNKGQRRKGLEKRMIAKLCVNMRSVGESLTSDIMAKIIELKLCVSLPITTNVDT